MATCSEVIQAAGRKLGFVNEGRPAATAWNAVNALECLQSLYTDAVARGMFGRLTEVIIDGDYEAEENERIFLTSGSEVVTRPTTITDADTGDVRPPRNFSVVQIAGASGTTWLYTLGQWVELTNLTLADTAPLSEISSDGLAAWLAGRYADQEGFPISQATIGVGNRFRSALATRLDGPRVETQAAYF